MTDSDVGLVRFISLPGEHTPSLSSPCPRFASMGAEHRLLSRKGNISLSERQHSLLPRSSNLLPSPLLVRHPARSTTTPSLFSPQQDLRHLLLGHPSPQLPPLNDKPEEESIALIAHIIPPRCSTASGVTDLIVPEGTDLWSPCKSRGTLYVLRSESRSCMFQRRVHN